MATQPIPSTRPEAPAKAAAHETGTTPNTHPSALPRWMRHALRVTLQLSGDALAIIIAYKIAYEIRFHWQWWVDWFPIWGTDPGWHSFRRPMAALIPMWLAIFWYAAQLYTNPWRRSTDRFLLILKGAFLGVLATLSASYIYDRLGFSRQMLILAVPIVVTFVSISEALVLWLDSRIARFEATSPILLVGGGRVAELIRINLRERHPGLPIHELEAFQDAAEVIRVAQSVGAAEIVMVRSSAAGMQTKILDLAEAAETAGIGFKMIPDILELRLGEIQLDDSLGLPAYRIQHTSLSPANFAFKRLVDILICLAVLAIAGTPLAILAILIKLDSKGPILFTQKRMGYKGRIFEAYKFRTMIEGAEARVHDVKTTANDQRGGFFKSKDDPRVTRVGRWLRRYSLDEFPQFINVFHGEMSAVGPRPLAVTTGELEALLREFGATAKKRFNILPGITGLWQVSGRSDVSSQQRFALDLFYIEHWSLGLDLDILLKTIPVMLGGKGAY